MWLLAGGKQYVLVVSTFLRFWAVAGRLKWGQFLLAGKAGILTTRRLKEMILLDGRLKKVTFF